MPGPAERVAAPLNASVRHIDSTVQPTTERNAVDSENELGRLDPQCTAPYLPTLGLPRWHDLLNTPRFPTAALARTLGRCALGNDDAATSGTGKGKISMVD